MQLLSLLSDRGAVSATIGLLASWTVVRFVFKLYHARSRVLKLKAQGLPMPPYNAVLGHLLFVYGITSEMPGDANPVMIPAMIRRKLPELGPIFYLDLWPFGPQVLVAGSLDSLRQVTQDHSLQKYHALKGFLEPIANGQDIVTMEGAAWKKWRNIFNPGFSMGNISTLAAGIIEETTIFHDKLETLSQSGKLFKMKSLTDYLALDIISNLVLGARLHSQTKPNPLASGLRSQIEWLDFGTGLKGWNPIRPFILWYNERRMDRFISPYLDQLLTRHNTGKTIINLAATAYLEPTEDQGPQRQMDAEFRSFAKNQIKMFLFAGHDTTSSTICYIYYVLATHSEIRENMRAEHDKYFGDNLDDAAELIKDDISMLNQLPYTTAVIKETLRLYPPASSVRSGEPGYNIVDNQHKREFPTDGFLVWSNHHAVHRNAAIWPEPDKMIPERWLVTADHPLYPTKGAWRPFELGPRNCIAQEMAIVEMKIVLIMTVRRFNIEPAYDKIDVGTKGPRKQVWGERGYQLDRAQPSGDLPCIVSFNR